jgi:hypothetical protein
VTRKKQEKKTYASTNEGHANTFPQLKRKVDHTMEEDLTNMQVMAKKKRGPTEMRQQRGRLEFDQAGFGNFGGVLEVNSTWRKTK